MTSSQIHPSKEHTVTSVLYFFIIDKTNNRQHMPYCCLIRMRIIQYAHGPDRIHTVGLHAYGLANFYTLNPLLTKSVKLPEQQTAEQIGQVSKPTKQQDKNGQVTRTTKQQNKLVSLANQQNSRKMVKLPEQQNSRTNVQVSTTTEKNCYFYADD